MKVRRAELGPAFLKRKVALSPDGPLYPPSPPPSPSPFVLSLSYRELAARRERISEGSRDDGSIGASESASESLLDPPDREFERTFGDFWSWLVEFPAQLASSTCATLTRKILVEVR